MTSTSSSSPTFLVLGSTGGCGLAFLARVLKAGYRCNALVRTPAKLTTMLEGKGITKNDLSNLNIIAGGIRDSAIISSALLLNGSLVGYIISGIGSYPKFTPNPLRPINEDPTLCEDGAVVVLRALKALQENPQHAVKKPTFIAISTTGMSDYGRDIPLVCVPLYHWMLESAHKDKKKMENLLIADSKSTGSAIGGYVVVRASLLNDKPGVGVDKLRVGVERDANIDKSAIGYFIPRDDVGAFIFEELVEDKRRKRSDYLNRCITITS